MAADPADEPCEKSKAVAFLFASQTGTAESIAKHLHEEALSRGFVSSCGRFDDYASVDWGAATSVVLVAITATTGDGDHPDNALKFWKWLRRAKAPEPLPAAVFGGRPYALLGLGDTNYTNFCQPAKRLDRKLAELGATPIVPKALADDATGLEATVDPWIQRLWDALNSHVVRDEEKAAAFEAMRATETKKKSAIPTNRNQNAEKKNNQSDSVADPKQTNDSKNNSVKESAQMDNQKSLSAFDECYAPRKFNIHQNMPQTIPPERSPAPPLPPPFVISKPTGTHRQPRTIFELLMPTQEAIPKQNSSQESSHQETDAISEQKSTQFSANNPFPARIASVRCLTGPKALEKVLEMELDISGAEWNFHPGDAFGLLAPNPSELVRPLLDRLGFASDEIVDLTPRDAECAASMPFVTSTAPTCFEIFSFFLELHAMPRKPFFRMLASHTTDERERDDLLLLASPRDRAGAYARMRAVRPTLLDILATFPSCKPPLSALIEGLGRLQPRFYSVACDRDEKNLSGHVRFAFNVVEYELSVPESDFKRPMRGICSSWLNRITGNTNSSAPVDMTSAASSLLVPFFPRASNHFRLPRDVTATKTPLILIAAGTGITPFIGFLEHLAKENDANASDRPVWVIHGHRFNDDDALYADRISDYIQRGIISRFVPCISRDTPQQSEPGCRYVQGAIEMYSEQLWDLIDVSNASVYVCGSLRVGKSVNDAMSGMVIKHRYDIQKPADALVYWNMKTHEHRYLRDLWG